MRLASTFLAAGALAAFSATASGQVVYGANPFPVGPIPIPDGPAVNVCTPGTEVLHTITVPDSGIVTDVNVHLNLTHTWYGDLDIMVTSPAGTMAFVKDGIPDDSSDLGGTYKLNDEAAMSWDAAATAVVGGVIAPGAYSVDVPLSTFDGENMHGTWTIKICDTFPADIGSLNGALLEICALNPSYGESPFPGGPIAIPDGPAPDVCTPGTEVIHTIVVPDAGTITDINVGLDLTHTWYGDLDIMVTSPAGTIAFVKDGLPDDSSNLGGLYVLDDEAPISWDAAALAVGGAVAIAPGSYSVDIPLGVFDGENKAGTWTIKICDTFPADLGSLNGTFLDIASEPFGVFRYGMGCLGSAGTAAKVVIPCTPKVGNIDFQVGVRDATPGVPAFLHVGIAFPPGFPLGFGCAVYLNLGFPIFVHPLTPITNAVGRAGVPLPIPPLPALVGGSAALQWAMLDLPAPLGFHLSDATDVTVQP
jgi:subtilisin-like proprotein convertase family protein